MVLHTLALAAVSAVNAVKALNSKDIIGAVICAIQCVKGLTEALSRISSQGVFAAIVETESPVEGLGQPVDLFAPEGQATIQQAAVTAATTSTAVMVSIRTSLSGGSVILIFGGEKQLSAIMGHAGGAFQTILSSAETAVVEGAVDTANEQVVSTAAETGVTSSTPSARPGFGNTLSAEQLERLQSQLRDVKEDTANMTAVDKGVHEALLRAALNVLCSTGSQIGGMKSALLPNACKNVTTSIADPSVRSQCEVTLSKLIVVDYSNGVFVLHLVEQTVSGATVEHIYFVDTGTMEVTQSDLGVEAGVATEATEPSVASTVLQRASIGLDLIPYVGTAKGVLELIVGVDAVTGEAIPRWVSAVGLVSFGKVLAKLGKTVPKVVGKAAEKKALGTQGAKGAVKQVTKAAEKEGGKTAASEVGTAAKNKDAAKGTESSLTKGAEPKKGMEDASSAKDGQISEPHNLKEDFMFEEVRTNPQSNPQDGKVEEIMKGKTNDPRITANDGKKMRYTKEVVTKDGGNTKYELHYVEIDGKGYNVKIVQIDRKPPSEPK